MQIRALEDFSDNNGILFGAFLICELTSFEELMHIYQKFKQDNPDKTIIFTLDDVYQAEYTSTHAKMYHNLDEVEGFDLTNLDDSAFEDGEHIGYLSTPTEFFIRKENFLKQAQKINFLSACNKGLMIDEKEILLLKKVHQSPFLYLDKEIVLKIIQVEKPYEAFVGFPNGYFFSDLDPFENYALAKHLFENYQYELFGIGASLLGFIRKMPLEKPQSQQLVSDLVQLYEVEPIIENHLLEIIEKGNFLFLKYTETLNC